MPEIQYFHVSTHTYSVGDVINSENQGASSTSRLPEVEARLENCRPPTAPSRHQCVFAFQSIALCGAFSGQTSVLGSSDAPNYYRVQPSNPWKAPMILVELTRQLVSLNRDTDLICAEYWNPIRTWRVYEVLCESFEIMEVVPEPDFYLPLIRRCSTVMISNKLNPITYCAP